MKLYLIDIPEGVDYDEFDGFVVAFKKAGDAKRFEHDYFPNDKKKRIVCIGNAADGIKDGDIILSSFKAG